MPQRALLIGAVVVAPSLHSVGAKTMIPTVILPHGVSVRTAADACRIALETFAVLEPTHLALVGWLSTHYRTALVGPRDQWPFLFGFSDRVERVITRAQQRLVELGREARDPAAGFVATLPTPVSIARIHDDRGNVGVAPIDVRAAPLEPRVVSLFLADYLSRPEYYLTSAARERWVTLGDGQILRDDVSTTNE